LLLVSHDLLLLLFVWTLWEKLKTWPIAKRVCFGLVAGFAASLLSGLFAEIAMRGLRQVGDRGVDLYFFPSFSLGWAHGALVVPLLSAKRRTYR
jgi:hypothetical protein